MGLDGSIGRTLRTKTDVFAAARIDGQDVRRPSPSDGKCSERPGSSRPVPPGEGLRGVEIRVRRWQNVRCLATSIHPSGPDFRPQRLTKTQSAPSTDVKFVTIGYGGACSLGRGWSGRCCHRVAELALGRA